MQKRRGKISAGLIAGLLFFSTFTNIQQGQSQTLRINEFMALNQSTLADEDTNYSDWIEIYNPTAEPVILKGWALTDEKDDPQKWEFPDITLKPNGYLIVFASGKDRIEPGSQLHTNFELSGDGEYLALFDPAVAVITEFDPMFPVQQTDVSYGNYGDTWTGFSDPTPGEDNQQSTAILLPAPVFNTKHGFYDNPFNLEISSGIPETKIYYTTDGSAPSVDHGALYSIPIDIHTTGIIRAVTTRDGKAPSRITTQTYLFLEDVVHQPNNPLGYPAKWGPYTAIADTAIADYEMDPEMMADPAFANSVKEALVDLPTISLVTDKGYFFSREVDTVTGGIYIFTGPPLSNTVNGLGDGWERPVSFEYFDNQDSVSLQVDCGVRLQGGHGRRPEKSPKHSFRLVFKSIYGPSKVNFPFFGEKAASSFNTIVLRAGFCNTWIHHSYDQRERAQYTRDSWGKDAQGDMGHIFAHGNYVHLYLNGMYWGLYNLTERIDKEFAASYLKGGDEDFDVIKDYTEVADGNIAAWNTMMAIADAGLESNEAYQRIQGNNPDGTPSDEYESMVDMVNLIDYMLINYYGGNTDWDHHNWVAIRNRVDPGRGFKFICWDEEHILKSLSENMFYLNNDNCPSHLFQKLRENEDFRHLFADRVQRHCYNNGVLTSTSAAERWIKRSDQVEQAVISESARWGDYRRDVHPYQAAGPFNLYTKEAYWLPQQVFLLNTYFPDRTDVFLSQLRSENLFPNVDAPVFLINDDPAFRTTITTGDILSMASAEGTIYYTTDGTDPVVWPSSAENNDILLIAEDADKRVVVPKSDIGNTWLSDTAYNDAGWLLCSGAPGGIGYEKDAGYEALITLDVGNDMHNDGGNPNPSCYIRIPFQVLTDSISACNSLLLNVRYDDGFAAFLNGIKVAEANAPATLQWNSVASAGHEATSAETFDLSEYLDNLTEGENLLTIQGLNINTSSSDFIITAELKAGSQSSKGSPSENALFYSDPLVLNGSNHIKARTYYNGEWSALNDRFFIIPANFYDIKITEVHYHPLDEDTIDDRKFEFVELKNTGTSTLDLGGSRFIQGIEYEFPSETEFKSNQFIVLASDPDYFYRRYGWFPFDNYKGQLSNSGEWIILTGPAQDTLCSFRYYDGMTWPDSTDGYGYSLVPTELNPTNDQNGGEYWRASYDIGGSPGADDLGDTLVGDELIIAANAPFIQNYPNPFSDITYINYRLPEDAHITLTIFNVVGQYVSTLVDEKQAAGNYQMAWNGTDQNHHKVANGVYVYRIAYENGHQSTSFTRKMLLIR